MTARVVRFHLPPGGPHSAAVDKIGIERAWDAAYQLVSGFDLPTMQPPADVTADGQ
jgi:hypothetical protein